jgi:hypothetical protein
LVTLGGIYQKEVEDILIVNNIERYVLVDDIFLSELENIKD